MKKTMIACLALCACAMGRSEGPATAASTPSEQRAPAPTPLVQRGTDQSGPIAAPEFPCDEAALHLGARSASTFEMSPEADAMVVIALDGHGVDLDVVVTQGDRSLAASIDDSATPIAFFRAPGGTITIDVINASDRACDYTWLAATLESAAPVAVSMVGAQ